MFFFLFFFDWPSWIINLESNSLVSTIIIDDKNGIVIDRNRVSAYKTCANYEEEKIVNVNCYSGIKHA